MLSHSLDFLSHFSLQKCIRFNPEASVWVAKQQILCTLNQSLKDVLNYGLFQPASNGRDGKFLDEERLLREYPQPVNKGVPSLEVFLDEKSEIMLYCSDADYTVFEVSVCISIAFGKQQSASLNLNSFSQKCQCLLAGGVTLHVTSKVCKESDLFGDLIRGLLSPEDIGDVL